MLPWSNFFHLQLASRSGAGLDNRMNNAMTTKSLLIDPNSGHAVVIVKMARKWACLLGESARVSRIKCGSQHDLVQLYSDYFLHTIRDLGTDLEVIALGGAALQVSGAWRVMPSHALIAPLSSTRTIQVTIQLHPIRAHHL
jgi:hypothetical protein